MSAPDTWAGLSSDEELAVTVAVMSALAAHRQAQVGQAVTGAGTFAVGVATDATPWGVTPASLTWWVLLAGFVLLSARAGSIAGAVSRMGNPLTDAWAWAHRTRPAGDVAFLALLVAVPFGPGGVAGVLVAAAASGVLAWSWGTWWTRPAHRCSGG